MRYRELLELYRKKELGEQEREMVEQDIEKHEAISDYLFEREESDTLNFGADLDQREAAEPGQKREDSAGHGKAEGGCGSRKRGSGSGTSEVVKKR